MVTEPVCNRLVFHILISGLLADLSKDLTETKQRTISEIRKEKKRNRRLTQANQNHYSPAAMGWLEESNWQLHISLIVLLSMHPRGKKKKYFAM